MTQSEQSIIAHAKARQELSNGQLTTPEQCSREKQWRVREAGEDDRCNRKRRLISGIILWLVFVTLIIRGDDSLLFLDAILQEMLKAVFMGRTDMAYSCDYVEYGARYKQC